VLQNQTWCIIVVVAVVVVVVVVVAVVVVVVVVVRRVKKDKGCSRTGSLAIMKRGYKTCGLMKEGKEGEVSNRGVSWRGGRGGE
jgi:uncharacterized membrane protein